MSVNQKPTVRLRKTPPHLAELASEFAAAQRRFVTPLQRLRWLVRFASLVSEESARLRSEEIVRLTAEILAFGSYTGHPQPPSQLARGGARKDLSDEQIFSLARDINGALESRVRGEMWVFSVTDRVSFFLTGAKNTKPVAFYGGDCADVLRLAARDLLVGEGHRIAKCDGPACERMFVRRKRGAYCSKNCSQRARTLRYRQSHSDELLSDRRHNQYVNKVRAEPGKENVLIRRNRRVVLEKANRSDNR